MNRTILSAAIVFGPSTVLLVDSAIKGAAILVLAAFVAMLLRRDSAATRHLVWLMAIMAMLVVPMYSVLLPRWQVLPAWGVTSHASLAVELPTHVVAIPRQVHVPVPAEQSPVERPSATSDQPPAEVAVSRPKVVVPDVTTEVTPESIAPSWNWISTLPLLWAIGFCLLTLRLMAARWMLWSNERRGTLIGPPGCPNDGSTVKENESDEAIVRAFETMRRQLAVPQHVRLLIRSERTIPVVWGIVRFRLLLPEAARQWSVEQLNSVLLHELAHIKRRDTMAQLLTQIACAVHWFNPLVWFAAWRLHVERECACDDLVLASGVRASTYAGHLLNVATSPQSPNGTFAGGLAMARHSPLEDRVAAILAKPRNRRRVTNSTVAASLLLEACIAIPIAMLSTADVEVAAKATADEVGATKPARDSGKAPRDHNAAFLLTRWRGSEGEKTMFPEASIAEVRVAIDKWVNQPSAKLTAARVKELRDWQLGRDEFPVSEVAAWLDEIAAIHPGALAFAVNAETTLVGVPLSEERQASLKFGPTAENGLRVAWNRYPARDTYLVGDVVYCSLVIQNASERTVEFECPHSLENIVTWEAKSDEGRTIEVVPARPPGTFPLFKWRLEPGAVGEIPGRYVMISDGKQLEETRDPRYFAFMRAKRGEQVTVHWNVREPVAMTTPDVSFKVVQIEDVAVWSTTQAGKWPLPGGVTMEVTQQIIHASDAVSRAILTWPADEKGNVARREIWLAGDAFANREPWLLAWERGASVLWAMSGPRQSPLLFHKAKPTPDSLRRIDFSDPRNTTETTWSYIPDVVPDTIRREFVREFLPLATTPLTPAHADPSHRVLTEPVKR